MADIVDEMLDKEWLRKGVSLTRSTTKPTSESAFESLFEIELCKHVNPFQVCQ